MIIVAYGTRPEHLKIEPLLKYWKSIGFNNWKVYLTFQHNNFCQNIIDTWEFNKNQLATSLEIPVTSENYNRLDDIITEILISSNDPYCLGNEFGTEKYQGQNVTAILVQGDTASAFACALAAFHRKIPIIHLEAGLRSFDNENPYPEEAYRRMISMMSTYNLCPTWKSAKNLENEKAPGQDFIVGNTILDSIVDKTATIENKILITLHRRENLSEIPEWFNVVEKLAEKYQDHEFILPIHKNPEIYKYKSMFKYVKCIEPLPHDDFIDILSSCKYIISDSGGVVEESSWFGKKIFLCRRETERPEAWQFYIKSPTPEKLYENFIKEMSLDIKDDLKAKCPFGDGHASEKIHEVLLKLNIIKT